jgi:hypothetical protein
MGLAGLKMISILFLIVLVALAGGSPVFARDEIEASITPAAACPGATVSISANIPLSDTFGGGIITTAMSPLSDGIQAAVSSDPDGLVATQNCLIHDTPVECTFLVSESASCGRYTVTVTLTENTGERILILGSASATFDVSGTCCAAVGGCVQPVNTFALVSPWLVVIGLVGCIGAAVVAAKKRRP